jgi:hypothetical protein
MIATHQQIVLALISVRPGAQWTLEGEMFDSSNPLPLEWHDTEQNRPSDAEVFDAITGGE